MTHDALDRYHRQMLLPGIGAEGQQKLRASSALLVGCGALGTSIADALTRAGIGRLVLIDRDFVEATNLQRQVLYTEDDVRAHRPKAEAARTRLAAINSDVTLEAHIDDFNASNATRLAQDVDIIIDGLDNFETRYLLNDLAVSMHVPYVYGGAVGTTGMSMTVLPRGSEHDTTRWDDDLTTPCLRCIFPEAPPPGSSPTCDTAGVLGPAVVTIAAWQSAQVLKYLTGNARDVDRRLLNLDIWRGTIRQFDVAHNGPDANCPCCAQRNFEYLRGENVSQTTSLCGRNAVQIVPATRPDDPPRALDLDALRAQLQPFGEFETNAHLLRGTFHEERGEQDDSIELTCFKNGRAIIKGTAEPERARQIYARYIGM